MAGTAMTSLVKVDKAWEVNGPFPIKSGDVVSHGMVGGMDTGGNIVEASKTQGAIVKGVGVIVFTDERGLNTSRTGNAGGTVTASIARRARLSALTSTLVPAIDDGLQVYLGALPAGGTVSNYTCTQTSTNGDLLQDLGWCDSPTTALIEVNRSFFKFQTAGNTTIGLQ